jgi:DNA-binding LytR/AlgR family response regulator
MKIAVCEDQKVYREQLVQNIQEWGEANNEPFIVHGYANAEIFLFHRVSDGPFDCLFIDIDLGEGANGVALAQKIRETDDKIVLIFVTALTDHVFSGYKVRALDYLIKPVNKSDLDNILRRVCDNAKDVRHNALFIKTPTEMRRVHYDGITYIESNLHYINIHTVNGIQKIRGTISTIVDQLPEDKFIRVHRSFLVNLDHIKTVYLNDITFYNGEHVPIGRKYRKEVDLRLLNYFEN